MSAPPRISQLSGDYKRDALPVQQAFDSIGACLKGGLTVAENMQAGWVEFNVRAPTSAAVQVRYASARAPMAVFLAGMWRTSPTYDAISVASSCSWTWNNGALTLPWLSGLTGTDLYLVRLLVMEA